MLLDGLDDPRRFALAHLVLTQRFRARESELVHTLEWPDDWHGGREQPRDAGLYYGLRVEFRPGPAPGQLPYDELGHVIPWRGHVDPGQRPQVRDYWHDQLDVPVASAGLGWASAAAGLPPLAWVAARGRRAWARRRRRRLGLCLACGYDLRGSPSGVCPECGLAAAKGATG